MSVDDKDPVTGTDTTGHEWDGIRELDNPLPRWWLWTFYATVVWSVGYMIAYPSLPFVGDSFRGALDYSSRAELHGEVAEADAAQAGLREKAASLSLAEIREDADVFQFAVAGGRAAFAVNCSQCHGSGAAGSPGYPNLNDDVWLWGGSLDEIYQTLRHGVRFPADDASRYSEMPAFGELGVLNRAQVLASAHYVRKLGGLDHDAARAEAGRAVYLEHCEACHKATGAGDREQGAPNLADAIWHYGSGIDEIARQISRPRHGVMPGWKDRLDDVTLKQLTIFVHALGGGE